MNSMETLDGLWDRTQYNRDCEQYGDHAHYGHAKYIGVRVRPVHSEACEARLLVNIFLATQVSNIIYNKPRVIRCELPIK